MTWTIGSRTARRDARAASVSSRPFQESTTTYQDAARARAGGPTSGAVSRHVGTAVQLVHAREALDVDVAVAEDRANAVAVGRVVGLDQEPARPVTVEVEAAQCRRLEPFQIEREQRHLWRPDLVKN